MKKFSFRLERLLKLRRRIEDEKRQTLAVSQARVLRQEEELRLITGERAKQNEAERNVLSGHVDVNLLRSFSRYFHKLKGDQRASERMKQVFESDAEKKSADLVGASQEKRALENYREKLKIRYDKQIEKLEQAELDELSAKRYIAARNIDNR